ncbi:DUF6197 family protein [Streptomyces griseoluteus]|uniref:DUF6197 family protein n=1 Tax=Streptomyces griseoluteus TaxID=29306 RepID=UPI003331854B
MTVRLQEASLAVDVNSAGIPLEPVDLADVVRAPLEAEPLPITWYPTPVAALLQRAQARMQVGGWCKGATADEDGAVCMYGAIRAEASTSAHASDAMAVLLEAIRRRFPGAETVPSFNDAQHGPHWPVRLLGEAADLANARDL